MAPSASALSTLIWNSLLPSAAHLQLSALRPRLVLQLKRTTLRQQCLSGTMPAGFTRLLLSAVLMAAVLRGLVLQTLSQ
jgi:hypothetical protein